MTTRQNTASKRKGRGGALPRERTYTTLTGTQPQPLPLSLTDPTSSFLASTTSTEAPTAAAAASNIMSSPFSVASSAGGSPNYQSYDFSTNPLNSHFPNYHNNSGNGYTMQPPIGHGSSSYGQPQFFDQSAGQNDLELLQKLKDSIKNNQHEFFRPIPQPAALASIYLGPPSSDVPSRTDQPDGDRQLGQNEYESSRDVASAGNSGNNGVSQARVRRDSSVWDVSRRPGAYPPAGNGVANTNVRFL